MLKRHGTTTHYASRNVLDGRVIGECMAKHRQKVPAVPGPGYSGKGAVASSRGQLWDAHRGRREGMAGEVPTGHVSPHADEFVVAEPMERWFREQT